MSRKISKNLLIFSFLVTILISGFLYKNAFSAYFFQDDWFTLRISNVKSVLSVFQFFIPRQDVIYYRPLGMQLPFFILQNIFGVNALPFHILTMVTHGLNIFLVFFLIQLIRKDRLVALISAFLYATSAVHYIPMFWPATYAFVLGPALFFLSFIFFILSENKTGRKFYFFSIGAFILALFTNEMTAVLPVTLLFYQVFIRKIDIKKLTPFFILTFSFLSLRFFFFPPPIHGTYQLGLTKDVLINLRAYLLWSFNWPEEMKAQFVSFWIVNSQFVREFSWYFWSFLITLIISVLFLYVFPAVFVFINKRTEFINLFIFSTIWFIFGLSPVVFFSTHSFSYYLPISLAGLTLFAVSGFVYFIREIYKLNKALTVLLVFLFLFNWLYSSFVTVDFNSKIHWAPRRAMLSKTLIDNLKNDSVPANADIAYIGDTSENKLALNDQDALRVIYNNDSFTTVYGKRVEK